MSAFQKKFDLAIWEVVNNIQAGRVMGYGEVAQAAGYPRHARMVSKAMSRSSVALPWHRVVRSNRTLAFEIDSDAYKKQAGRLEKEGVKIKKGKVIPKRSDNDVSLDELLWGAGEYDMGKTITIAVAIFTLISACQSTKPKNLFKEPPLASASTMCKDPRPEICTQEYIPVCATKDTGVRCVTTPCPSTEQVTYPNACTACADKKVYSHVPSACGK